MSNIIKSVNLNILIIKQHTKVLIYIMLIGLFLLISSKSLIASIITTMTIIPLKGTSILFQVEEKNKLDKFYGFIPIKKSDLIIGRYVFIILGGLSILIISLLIQPLILIYIGISINTTEYFLSFVFGLATYLFTISTQLPGFYKFGSINGSAFSYIPLIFFAISFYLTGIFDSFGIRTIALILNNLNLVSLIFLFISMVYTLISILISINIYKNKQ